MSESKRKISLGISDLALEEIVKIMKIFANEESINIILSSKKGLTSSKENLRSLGLTQKKFYSRIKDLIDAGIITKKEGKYKLTQLGKILINAITNLEPILLMKDKLKVIDELEDLGVMTENKKNHFIKMLFPEEINSFFTMDAKSKTYIIPTFEDLKKELIDEIGKSDKNILFIFKYFDSSITDICIKKVESNIEIFLIIEEFKIQDAKKVITLLLSPKSIKIIYDFFNKYKKHIRVVEKIENSFIIIDNKIAIIEITNPLDGSFLFSVKIKDKKIIDILIEIFFNMWKVGKDFSLYR